VTDRQSFNNVEQWVKFLERTRCTKFLVGTKCDVTDHNRQVTRQEAKLLAQKLKMKYVEISSVENNDSTRELFDHFLNSIYLECGTQLTKKQHRKSGNFASINQIEIEESEPCCCCAPTIGRLYSWFCNFFFICVPGEVEYEQLA
jgi:GTPase SAR1 family protein